MTLNKLLKDIIQLYLKDDPKIMLEASWVLLNSTQKMNEKTIDMMLKNNIVRVFEIKIEQGNLTEENEDVIITFLEEFLKKSMKFKAHKLIKATYRKGKIMDFLKPLAAKKNESDNGLKAYGLIARYFKDIKEELSTIIISCANS